MTRFKGFTLVASFVFCACLIFFTGTYDACFGWSGHTHRKIVSDALNRMPQLFRDRFLPFKDAMLKGATYPDSDLKDFNNHVYHIHGRSHHESLARAREMFSLIAGMLKRHEQDADIAFQLGIYAHYIGDWNQPLHTDGADVDPDEDSYHMAFEKEVEGQLSRIPIATMTYQPVKDPATRLQEMAAAANVFYLDIGKAYRHGRRIFDLQEMLRKQYGASVENVINYWLGIFAAADQPLDPASGTVFLSSDFISGPAIKGHPELSLSRSGATGVSPVPNTGMADMKLRLVNLNTASIQELLTLPGVGEKKARAIMASRPFRSPYDLARVKGFGSKMTERILDRITTDSPPAILR
ncbi:MAG: helix-hairpin-helix domain-containing protein [Candidatus Riflebacteria bacterium]|nr:helix-hairpin-helix domain-containing protein [Candidatus Riflebacteria bacterium]